MHCRFAPNQGLTTLSCLYVTVCGSMNRCVARSTHICIVVANAPTGFMQGESREGERRKCATSSGLSHMSSTERSVGLEEPGGRSHSGGLCSNAVLVVPHGRGES